MRIGIYKMREGFRCFHFNYNKEMMCVEFTIYYWNIFICWGVEPK